MDNEHVNSIARFAKRHINAVLIPSTKKVEGEVIPIRPKADTDRLLEISLIYNELVHPVVTALESHGFEREAMLLSQNAGESLELGASRDIIAKQVKQELDDIDPELAELILSDTDILGPSPE